MPSYAQIDQNNTVIKVITSTPQFIRSGQVGDPEMWLECSRNGSIRARFPGTGWLYDPELDEFFPPKPYDNWVWRKNIWNGSESWEPPIPFPLTPESNQTARWDQESGQWIIEGGGHDPILDAKPVDDL